MCNINIIYLPFVKIKQKIVIMRKMQHKAKNVQPNLLEKGESVAYNKYAEFDLCRGGFLVKKQMVKILSLAMSVVLVAVLSSCGGETETVTKKKKKVIIKKVPNSSQTSDTDSVSSDDNTYSYDDNSSDVEAPSDEPSDDSSSEYVSPYEVELKGYKVSATDKKIGLAMYHNSVGDWDALFADTYGKESTFMNYYRVGTIEQAKQVKAANGMCWLYVTEPYKNRDSLEFSPTYEENFKMRVQAFKDAGVWDVIAGFETEEITTRITHEQFKKFTKFLRDTCPEKRILACTSPYEIQGITLNGFIVEPMDYETFAYVTDIGFDMYHTADYSEHAALLKEMKEKLGRKDVRIWFFPCTYKYWSTTSEDYMIKSLDIAYDLLMKEENPGGIYMYTWRTWGGDYGLEDLLNPNGQQKYTRLAKRIMEIGKEILASDYVYNKSFN